MRIYHNQLTNTLNQGVKPVWLIFGDEPWQKNDALTQIKHHAQQNGFEETIRFSVDDKFDWSQITEEYQSLSLFANLRVIELELTSNKIGDQGSKILSQISEDLCPDILLIIHGQKLDGASQKRKWFKALDKHGVFLPIYDIEGKHLTQWIQGQARANQLNLAPNLILLLAELFEGNLPSLSQELTKLSLLYGNQLVSIEDAEAIVIKQAKFNPFQLVDSMLSGNINKCVAMLDQLQHEGVAAAQIIWILHKEIKQLTEMQNMLVQGLPLSELYKQYRIWDKRKPIYQHALTNISSANLASAQARLADTDLISKTSSEFNPFILLADVMASLYHGDRLKTLSLDYEFS